MKTKHTPKPWVIVEEYGFTTEIHSNAVYNGDLDSMMNGEQVCIVTEEYDEREYSQEEINANAKLIAAAPELLEYAKADLLFESAGSFTYKGESITGREAQLRLAIMRGEAIKKATP